MNENEKAKLTMVLYAQYPLQLMMGKRSVK